ncbi:acyltransferase family protein [Paucilactobacillus kaifaensis]|uniref:acyltransferase family protein n=1 Tax=Paucilactobacillus kaifaensis TaxID=2559921 RepID=UPI0010F4DE08|nr:acyltransferase family protein [Paucilactobacillus kaifaensis]
MQPEFEQNQLGLRSERRRYITGFDGLRTLAVVGVIVYHLLPATLQGGYLGVPIFLLITGYLITNQLVNEWNRTGNLRLGHFYWKRITRLYPVLITMLITTTAYITLFERNLLRDIRGTIWTNLLYVYNWWEIGHGQSYFDRFAGESPFTHLWTLGIEGQFYLIWPLVLIGCFLVFRRRALIGWFTLGLAIVSAILMAVLYNPGNINRVYYGSDTRGFAILLGAWLAFIWPMNSLSKRISRSASLFLDAIGTVSALILIYGYFQLSGQADFTYHGGMFLITFAGMLLMGTIAHPGSHMNRIFSNPVFKWIGDRSYGIYVYQYPVLVFYELRVKNMADHPVWHALIELAIILIISELSYRFIESPLRFYDWTNLGTTIKGWFSTKSVWRHWLVIIPSLIVTVIAAVGMVQQPTKAEPNKLQTQLEKKNKATKAHNEAIKKGTATKSTDTSEASTSVESTYSLTKAQVEQAKQIKVTAVGDSVLADSSSDIQTVLPNAYVSAQVGRQVWQTPGIIRDLASKGQLADNVVLNLGTNGALNSQSVKNVLDAIGPGHQIYCITAHVPTKNWQGTVNNMIKKTARQHKNVHVIDWYQYSEGHADWFSADNVHPSVKGNVQFARLVVTELLKNN